MNSLEKKLELLRKNAEKLIARENKKKYINNFYRSYDKFTQYLTSDLASYDLETRTGIKNELTKLTQLIEDTVEEYLT